MTGFGHGAGAAAGRTWAWEIRSVNHRGLDLRFRLPSGMEADEARLREAAQASFRRGSLQISLTLTAETPPEAGPVVQRAVLDRLTQEAVALADRIPGALPPRAEALLALPGVLAAATTERGLPPPLRQAALAGFAPALAALEAARQEEGARLHAALSAQLDQVAALLARAARLAEHQPHAQAQRLRETLALLLPADNPVAPERLAQEIALLAQKADVREELDRLASHIAAARALLAEGEAIGRRLDFLTQEFNREINTLCSKSASIELTATGLELKATLEQFREQVQNVE